MFIVLTLKYFLEKLSNEDILNFDENLATTTFRTVFAESEIEKVMHNMYIISSYVHRLDKLYGRQIFVFKF